MVKRSLSFMRSRAALTKYVVPSRRAAITASGGSRSGQSDTSTLCSPAALNRSSRSFTTRSPCAEFSFNPHTTTPFPRKRTAYQKPACDQSASTAASKKR